MGSLKSFNKVNVDENKPDPYQGSGGRERKDDSPELFKANAVKNTFSAVHSDSLIQKEKRFPVDQAAGTDVAVEQVPENLEEICP